MSKFTKGKWSINSVGYITSDIEPEFEHDSLGHPYVWLDDFIEEHRANARLVAAAPEMYHLLQNFVHAKNALGVLFLRDEASELLNQIDGNELQKDEG